MSLKENVNYFKEEITTEEKFFEGFFKLEVIWKKYKIALIGGIALIALVFVGTNVNDYMQTQNKIKTNIAFNTLLETPNDSAAIAVLKDGNPQLLSIVQYIINRDNNKDFDIDVKYLDNIATYNKAVNNNDIKTVNQTIMNSKFLLKDYAIFQKALMQALNENYTDAKETLKLIPISSEVSKLSNKLSHYLLTK